jgi:hypothetical protein
MGKFNLFAKLIQFMNPQTADMPTFTRKQLKKMRPPRYKPASSVGFRGFPKTETPPGMVAAPTIDQVRRRERKYGQRIHVKNGLMFFASDGYMWTKKKHVNAGKPQSVAPKLT